MDPKYFDNVIRKCSLNKLSRNFEEKESHDEFEAWQKNLCLNFPTLIQLVNNINPKECSATTLSSLFILHHELQSDGQWKSEKNQEYLKELDDQFNLKFNESLNNILYNHNVFNVQEVFDKCMEILHKTMSASEIKKYPTLIEVYYLILLDVKSYKISMKLSSVIPISLLLTEDYVQSNKIKGLQCCSSILESLESNYFHDGNYYEVIYSVIKKRLIDNDLKVTNLVLECLLHLYNALPPQTKISIMDDTLQIVVDQLYTETNLYRKKSLFSFLIKIIPLLGIHCVRRKMILTVINDNLDVCCNDAVAEILLHTVLECLETWTRYCWFAWRLGQNSKILSLLMKLFYIFYKDDDISLKTQNIIVTLIKLGSVKEQNQVAETLEKCYYELKNYEGFSKRLDELKIKLEQEL